MAQKRKSDPVSPNNVKRHCPVRIPTGRVTTNPRAKARPSLGFLGLPGEIRNIIYDYALVDHHYSLRFRQRITKDQMTVQREYRRSRTGPDRDDLPGQGKGSLTASITCFTTYANTDRRSWSFRFGVGLLGTNRKVREEAASMFFGQNFFTFLHSTDLYAFLVHFEGHKTRIRQIGLHHWPSHSRGQFMEHHAAFSMLAGAINLQALHFSSLYLHCISYSPLMVAKELYKSAHGWLHAMGVHHKNRMAALGIMKFPTTATNRSGWAIKKENQDRLLLALAQRLLL